MRRSRPRPSSFAFTDETRTHLATVLRQLRLAPDKIRSAIEELQHRARDFVETAAEGAHDTHDAVRGLETLTAKLEAVLRTLPPKARALVTERLVLDRSLSHDVLNRAAEMLRHLRYAARHVNAELVARRRPGRPTDVRGQGLAVDLAMILQLYGVPIAKTRDGLLAECLAIVFEAAGHPHGDMGTLLDAVVSRLGAL